MTPSRCCVGCDFVFAGWHGVNKSRTRSARHHRQVGAGHGIKNEVVYAVKARTHLNAQRLTGRPRDVDSKASRKNPEDKKSARPRAPQLPPPVAQKKQGHASRGHITLKTARKLPSRFCLAVYLASVPDGDSQDRKLIVFDFGDEPIVADAIAP